MAKKTKSRLDAAFADYAAYHKTRGNQMTHYLGIPMIVLSTLGLLAQVPLAGGPEALNGWVRLDLGTVLWAVSSLWYLSLDLKLSIPYLIVAYGFYLAGRTFPMQVNWGLFILGWIVQFIGHSVYEKRSPAFFTNARHLLIGPFWIFAKLFR